MSTHTATLSNEELKTLFAYIKITENKPRNKDLAAALNISQGYS
jgi:hypothetical protein